MLKKITAYKWYMSASDIHTSTGKEYIVLFDREVGVQTILSVNAVQKFDHEIINRIDITESEVQGADLDAMIDGMFDWDSLQAEQSADAPQNDQFWNMAKDIARNQARSFRH